MWFGVILNSMMALFNIYVLYGVLVEIFSSDKLY